MKPLLWLLLSTTLLYSAHLPVRLESRYGVLINVETGGVIVEKRPHEKIYPSSTAKIATALYVLYLLKDEDLDREVEAPKEVLKKVRPNYKYAHLDELSPYILQKDGTSYRVRAGERLSYRSLLYGLLIASGNDAANVLAYHLGEGSIERFMEAMNRYLASLGCTKTHFVNPHGLHHPDQYSTPYEMALIGVEALKYPLIREIINTQKYEREQTNKQKAHTIEQPNKLVKEGKLHFEAAHGMKTGYTAAGGYCLLSCASDGDRQLVAALFDAKEDVHRYRDAIELFTRAFEEKKVERKLFNAYSEPFVAPFLEHSLKMVTHEEVSVDYYASENPQFTTNIAVGIEQLPVAKGQWVGTLQVLRDNTLIKEIDLYAAKSIPKPIHWGWWLVSGVLALYIGYKGRQVLKRRRALSDQE